MLEVSLDNFLFRALLGGIGVALLAAPLGCFVVWQRMAYFGAALSHSALLGVALGLVLGMPITLGVVLVCVLLGVVMTFIQLRPEVSRQIPLDTMLGILAHAALALGLVLLVFIDDIRFDVNAYLFGDVLAIGKPDLILILVVGVVVWGTLVFIWKQLLEITINDEVAAVEGVSVKRVRFIYMLLMALVIAVVIKIVGMLLITSLLIIPPAAARRIAHTPEQMAVFSSVVGVIAVLAGLSASVQWDLPAGPSIVLAALCLLPVITLLPGRR